MMITRELAALGKQLGTLCLGTMNFGVGLSQQQSFDILDAFVQMGGNFIDTARVYGDFDKGIQGISEQVIGKWVRARGNRNQVVIATKGGHPPMDDMHHGRLDAQSLKADLQSSLEALDTDAIDIYWLHRDEAERPVIEILETLNQFIEDKKIRAIGASNWTPERLREAFSAAYEHSLTGFSCNQPMWSLAQAQGLGDTTLYQMDHKMYYWHTDSHMACMPYTSQAKGFFQKMADGGEAALKGKASERYLTPENVRLFEKAKEIGAEKGVSAGAVALAYLTNQSEFSVYPIVGVSSMAQLEALKETADLVLEPSQMERLREANWLK